MNVLDLFSGIGGFSLGLERAGMRTVAFCERDEFCQSVLGKHWPGLPVAPDITKREFREGEADIITVPDYVWIDHGTDPTSCYPY